MPWYVLYTKPRNEKKVTGLLAEKGVEVYCPQHEVIKQWSDRKKKVIEPVFRSYIFVALDNYKEHATTILETPGAVRFLWWAGKPGIVRDQEITAIRDFLDAYRHAAITVEIKEGQKVTVTEGVLKGSEGVVSKVKGNKATLYLAMLGMNLVATLPVQSLSGK